MCGLLHRLRSKTRMCCCCCWCCYTRIGWYEACVSVTCQWQLPVTWVHVNKGNLNIDSFLALVCQAERDRSSTLHVGHAPSPPPAQEVPPGGLPPLTCFNALPNPNLRLRLNTRLNWHNLQVFASLNNGNRGYYPQTSTVGHTVDLLVVFSLFAVTVWPTVVVSICCLCLCVVHQCWLSALSSCLLLLVITCWLSAVV